MGPQSRLNQTRLPSTPTVLPYESLLGLDVFLKDLGWNVVKARQGISDDQVHRIAEGGPYILVTEDEVLAARCRLNRAKMVEPWVEEPASIVDQILHRDFKI